MADVKISGLPASTVPLAGTEVLPIVQSGVTKKVSSDDLTVKNVRSNATNGILQVAGPAAASTRVMTVPDANFTVARIDAANSFSGDQTLSNGNLIIGTSGKGIDFSATSQASGMTSELFSDYEEGTWTPQFVDDSGGNNCAEAAGGTNGAYYTKIGNLVICSFRWGITGAGAFQANIMGLPYSASNLSGKGLNANAMVGTNHTDSWIIVSTTRIDIGGVQTDLPNPFRATFAYFTN